MWDEGERKVPLAFASNKRKVKRTRRAGIGKEKEEEERARRGD